MNMPNSALAYFSKAQKVTFIHHRIFEGKNGTAATVKNNNDLVKWHSSFESAQEYYLSKGFTLTDTSSKYGRGFDAYKDLNDSPCE